MQTTTVKILCKDCGVQEIPNVTDINTDHGVLKISAQAPDGKIVILMFAINAWDSLTFDLEGE